MGPFLYVSYPRLYAIVVVTILAVEALLALLNASSKQCQLQLAISRLPEILVPFCNCEHVVSSGKRVSV